MGGGDGGDGGDKTPQLFKWGGKTPHFVWHEPPISKRCTPKKIIVANTQFSFGQSSVAVLGWGRGGRGGPPKIYLLSHFFSIA